MTDEELIKLLLSSTVISLCVSAITTALLNWLLEERRFRREQQLADLRRRRDEYYSQLLFHFENMRSWSIRLGPRARFDYEFSEQELRNKTTDMYHLMRSGMGMVSAEVMKLWFEWQPIATTPRGLWHQYENEQWNERSRRLHEAVRKDFDALVKQIKKISGEGT